MRHGKYLRQQSARLSPPPGRSFYRVSPFYSNLVLYIVNLILFDNVITTLSEVSPLWTERPSRAIDFCRNQVKTLRLPPVQRGELSGQMLGLLFLFVFSPFEPHKKMPGWRKRLKDQTPTIRCRFPLFTFFLFSPPKLTLPWLFGIADLFFWFSISKRRRKRRRDDRSSEPKPLTPDDKRQKAKKMWLWVHIAYQWRIHRSSPLALPTPVNDIEWPLSNVSYRIYRSVYVCFSTNSTQREKDNGEKWRLCDLLAEPAWLPPPPRLFSRVLLTSCHIRTERRRERERMMMS